MGSWTSKILDLADNHKTGLFLCFGSEFYRGTFYACTFFYPHDAMHHKVTASGPLPGLRPCFLEFVNVNGGAKGFPCNYAMLHGLGLTGNVS
jgi:hypothetical protein